MSVKLSIIFYSMYGHVYKLTEAVIEGACSVSNVKVDLYRVPEIVPEIILEKSGAKQAQQVFSHVPVIQMEKIHDTDGFIFGTPTRFGDMCAQMRHFLDKLDKSSVTHFANKVGSVYTHMPSQYCSHDNATTHFHRTLLQLGMVIVGLPHAETRQKISMNTVNPPTAAMLTGRDVKCMPSANELDIAWFHGKHVAETTKALKQGRSFLA